MKRKWLIAIASLAMAITFVLGISACKPKEAVKSDEEVAQTVINTLNSLYLKDGEVKNYETPDNYKVLGQVNVDGTLYAVTWTPTAKTQNVTVGDYVTVSAMDDKGQVTVEIKRATVDIEYTLTASVTAGSVIKTASYDHKIPKKSSEEAITATIDLSSATNRVSLDTDNNEQTWKQNGVTLFNHGNVADYTPIRLYKNTTIEISMENAKIIHIDFHSAQGYSDSPYPEWLKTSLESSDLPIKGEIAVSEDGLTISVDFESPQEVVIFKATAGQLRLTSMDVEAIERDPNEHVHNWTYEHIANTWTHKATCTAEGCDVNTKTESCTPKRNVCACGYTYTAKEIVDALFALEKDQSLPGTYSLTGLVTKITDPYSTQYNNVTFEMTVEGKTITAFRVKGSHATEVKVGGYATVNGELLDYNGTKEFTQGGSVVAFSDERTAQQKVDAALQAVAATVTVTKTGDTALPASTEPDVTFAWDLKSGENLPEGTTFANGKLTVNTLPAEDATVTFVVTATCGTETVTGNTKEVTVTIKAEGSAVEGFQPITAPAAGSDFYLAMDIKGEWYYSTGKKSGNYLGTTTDISKAAKVTVAASGSGWTLVTDGKYIELETSEPNSEGKTYVNIMLKDAQTEGKVWMWNTEHSVFTMEEGGVTYFMGTYGDYNTFNSANISFIKNDNEYIGKIGTYTGEITPPTPGEDVTLPDGDVKFDFSSVTEHGSEIAPGDATTYFKTFTQSADLTAAAVTEKVYKGNGTGGGDYENAGGMLKLGTSKVGATITLTFAKNVTKVVILAQGWPGKSDTLTVNGGTAQTLSNSEKTLYTFDLAAPAQEIEITSNLRAFIFGIVVTFGNGAPEPETDDAKVDKALAAVKAALTVEAAGDFTLPTSTVDGVTFTWSTEDKTYTITGGGALKVDALPETDTTVNLTLTATCNQVTKTKQVTVTIKAEESFKPLTAPVAGNNYYMGMKTQDGQYHYLTGVMNNYYMATTTDIAQAKKVTLAGSETAGWTMVLDGKYIEIELSGTHINAVYKTSQTAGRVWKWDSQYNIFTMEFDGGKYFLGTYSSYTTVGGEDYAQHVSDSDGWKAVLGTYGTGGTTTPKTDAEKVADVKAALKLSKTELLTVGEEVELPATQGEATITWALSGTSDLVKLEGGKLIVQKLPAEDSEVTLIATITVGAASDTTDVKITVKAEGTKSFVPMAKPKAGSNYYMGMKTQDGQYHYLTGAMASGSASHYMATVTDIESAKKVTLAGSDTAGWTMQCEGKYIEITVSGTYYNAVYNTTKSGTWKWDATHSFFTWTVNGSVYALGTYGTYTTVGTVAQSRFDDSGEWFAVLGTWGAPEVTDQDKVDEALAAVETEYDVAVTGDYALPTPTVEGVTFAWQVTEGSYSLTNGNSLNIQSLPAEDTEVKLTLTATCGTEGTGTKEITVTVHPAGWTKHVHNYQYAYTSGLKHTRTCTAPGCDEEGPVEEACTPELNVCPFCEHTATAEEACNAVWSFPTGTAKYLPGTYTFSGIVNQKDGTKSGNTWEFEYKVFLSDGTVDANQTTRYELFVLKATVADGLNITELLEGDKVTVTGSIGFDKRNSSQWWRGFMTTDAKITAYTKKTDEEKATEIMKKLGDSFDEIPAEQKTFKKIQSQVLSLPVIKSTFGYYSKAGSSVWTIADEGMKQYCSISVGTDAAYLNIKAVPDVETKIKLKLTVTFGTVVKEKECEVTLAVMTDQEMADEAATITKAPKERFFTVGETLELPAKSDKYPKASLSWAVKETSEYAKIENNVLTISKLPEDADTKVTLVVTATVNGTAGSPHELEITLMLRDKFTPITTPAYGYYHLSVEYYYNGSENFLSSFALKNSGKNTQYLETNKDVEKAVVVALVPIPGETNKFFIKATGGSNDNLNYLYINTISGTKVIAVTTSLTSANTPLATWEWDAENHIFFVTIGEEKYIMGGTNSSQLQVNTLTYAKEHSSFNYARLGTYEGHEEKLTAPAQATSIKLFDATGVEINSGDTVKVKAEENWGIVLHYTVAPEAPLSARLTLTSEDTTKVLASFGSSAMGFTVYARSAAQAGDKVKLTITVLDTNVTAELTVEVVAAGEIQDVHGEKVTDPMTIEELKAYVTKLDSSVKGAYAKAGYNRNFYVKGKLIVEEGSDSYRNCYLGNNKEISLGSLSASSLKDTAKEMGLQLADFNGIEVIVSGDFGFRTLTDGNTQLAARTANIHQANFTADDKIAFAQAALTVDFAAFKAVDAEIDLAAAAVNKFDVTVAWALTAPVDASTYVTLADNKLKIVKLPGEVTEFTLKATLTLEGGTEATKEFTFFLVPASDVLFDMSKNTSTTSNALSVANAKSFLNTACGSNAALTGVTTATQVFKGNSSGGPFQGAGCMKLGASGKNAELVLTFSKKVAKVIIVWASWSASEGKLTVNEVGSDTFYSTFTTETFTLTTASETLTIKSTGRVVITSISVYFETAPAEITIPEEMRGTFKCTGGMDIEEGGLDPDFDGSNVPDLVVSEHSITWGENVITDLKAGEDGAPGSFTFKIGDDRYGLTFTGAWMLVKFGPEGEEPVEGYMFGDMGGGPELGL